MYYIKRYNINKRRWVRGTKGYKTREEAEMFKDSNDIIVFCKGGLYNG